MGFKDYTGQLYATPSPLDGLAGLVNFTDTEEEYNVSDSTEEADEEAIRSDWNAVGQDIRKGISLFKREHKK